MNVSMMIPPIEQRIALWKADPRCKEYDQKTADKFAYRAATSNFDYNVFKNFTGNFEPIPHESTRNISELSKRFHPAAIQNDTLCKIISFARAFTCDPVVGEQIPKVDPVGHCITLHTNFLPGSFRPSTKEVLLQLPDEIINAEGEFYYTTDLISHDPDLCAIGNSYNYHIALTSVFKAV